MPWSRPNVKTKGGTRRLEDQDIHVLPRVAHIANAPSRSEPWRQRTVGFAESISMICETDLRPKSRTGIVGTTRARRSQWFRE
jgi:hypothetical protein